jgi:hypothetical protein
LSKSFDYSNYNKEWADDYAKKLEALLVKAGQAIPSAN